MIKDAMLRDKQEIYEIWKSAYPTRERNYLNFFFKHIYDEGKSIVCEQDGRIISTLQYHEHIMMFQKRKLSTSYIMGVATLPDYRLRGHMRRLMESTLDELSRNHLITLIQAFNPKLYEQFGFETIYYHKHYTIHAKYLEKINIHGVDRNFTASELLGLYKKYVKHFDGYYIRDMAYYENFMRMAMINRGNICVYRNKKDEITGYAYYVENNNEVEIKEIIYLESIALLKMMKYVLGRYPDVNICVSQAERLEKLFPLAIPKKVPFMMARINNYELFNKLYNCDVRKPSQAYEILNKPLFINEFY